MLYRIISVQKAKQGFRSAIDSVSVHITPENTEEDIPGLRYLMKTADFWGTRNSNISLLHPTLHIAVDLGWLERHYGRF